MVYIDINNLNKSYNNRKAINNLSIRFEKGMNGLLGPNGAGKTTLMKIICNILQKDSGSISYGGADTDIRNLVGYLPQHFSFYPNFSVYDTLDYFSILSEMKNKKNRKKRILEVLEQVNLESESKTKIAKLSGGMLRRLGVAQAMLHEPQILIIDEPTVGLSPEERIRFRNVIEDFSENRVVLLSTHIVSDVEFTCNKIFVLDKGEIIFDGEINELQEIAKGFVWIGEVERAKLRELENSLNIISQVKKKHKVTIKCLCKDIPFCGFELVEQPNLEDAYLFLTTMKNY